jgi:hypothetical protein
MKQPTFVSLPNPIPPGTDAQRSLKATLTSGLLAGARRAGGLLANGLVTAFGFLQLAARVPGIVGDVPPAPEPVVLRVNGSAKPASRRAEPANNARRLCAAGDAAKCVEDALRHLYDYAYLGAHPLAGWQLVRSRAGSAGSVSVDRGRVVYNLLVEAIEKLRPGGKPGSLPSRLWYPYLILHRAYVENITNRDIMAHLNISEGMFNRTRRQALQAVASLLEEMDAAQNR